MMILNTRKNMETDMTSVAELTIRDYFAAYAIQALINKGETNIYVVAKDAYAIAAAMVEERAK
jgi:hypothetical protein